MNARRARRRNCSGSGLALTVAVLLRCPELLKPAVNRAMITGDASVDDAGGRGMLHRIGVRRFRGFAIGLISSVVAAGLIATPAAGVTTAPTLSASTTSASTTTSTG